MPGALEHWTRLLWNRTPPVRFDAEQPHLSAGTIHLPPAAPWSAHRAATAHAVAHLVFSPPRFDGRGLAPVARALLGLLEDARIEALAGRELPGLARLWRACHRAHPDDGAGCEALLGRLARALADPGYADPHPWVVKGRRLFYLDEAQEVVALRTPAELRRAATRLGHDIGQMRLAFNAGSYRPSPAYRDDHRWMWSADAPAAVASPPAPRHGEASPDPPIDPAEALAPFRHPEWDRLIARLRVDWCTVVEHEAGAVSEALPKPGRPCPTQLPGLRDALRPLTRMDRSPRRAEGEALDLDALVDWRLAQVLRSAPDGRVYRGRERRATRPAVWLLIDQSASTAIEREDGRTVLQAAAGSALALTTALQSVGARCEVAGFESRGRHDVRLRVVKRSGAPLDAGLGARLDALRPGGSTRLGAALRHATARLAGDASSVRWVLLLSDGEPHDIDVHDPRYLTDDARHAVRWAARRSVRVGCLHVGRDVPGDARRIFGPRGVQPVRRPGELPLAIRRLMG